MSTITIHDYDSEVIELFAEAKEILQKELPDAKIHHVGSTSIREMGGKGMIDILIGIPDWSHKALAGERLVKLGFTHVHKEINSRIFLSRVGETVKNDVHLHLTYIGSSEYENILAFRDYLRTHSNEAKEYLQLKRDWLKQSSGERKVYTSLKGAYIAQVLAKAEAQQIIISIRDKDFNPQYTEPKDTRYTTRVASRGILINDGKIAMLHVTKLGYHKLPGGGLENNEKPVEAFKREILEETGCICTIDDENADILTLEWRGKWQLFQPSHIFSAHVVGDPQGINFTEEETENGFELKWVTFDQIIQLLESDTATDYESQFIMRRDRAIVDFYLNEKSS